MSLGDAMSLAAGSSGSQAGCCNDAFDTFFFCHRAAPLPSAVTLHLEMLPSASPHFCSSLFLCFGLCREKKCMKNGRLIGREWEGSAVLP